MAARPSAASLRRALAACRGRRVVVWGDIVCDEYLHCSLDRISREAPVLILLFERRERMLGGAGNSAHNVHTLGGRPVPVGALGADGPGRALLRLYREIGAATSGILRPRGYRTPTKTRVLAGGPHHSVRQQVLRIDAPGRLSTAGRAGEALRARLSAALRGAHAVLVSDYDLGAVDPGIAAWLVAEAGRRRLPVAVDSRHRLGALRGATVATPNEPEAEEILGGPLPARPDRLARAGRELIRRTGCPAVIVTRGKRGMVVFDGDRAPAHVPIHGTDEVADVTGAGDTVIAAIALSLAARLPLLTAAWLATIAAGIKVTKRGTAAVRAEEVAAALRAI